MISRAGDHERKRTIKAALDRLGVDFSFFDATMGADLSAAQLAAAYDEQGALHHKTISRRMHPSNIGCSISHQRVYAHIVDHAWPSAVVLEDDARPLQENFTGLTEVIAELPTDRDLLYLGFRGHRHAPLLFPLRRYLYHPLARLLFPKKYRLTVAETSRLYLRPFSKRLYRAGYHQGSHAYAISAKGARIVMQHTAKITAPADAILATLVIEGKLNAFTLKQNLFTTTGQASQIVSEVMSS
ncbi:MAG: glycosyltransferase family 25 protein [Flavobacteriales bacterium]